MATTKPTADQVTRDAIHRALPGPKGGWSPARTVAETVGRGYSTVTEHLRAMALAGAVEWSRQGRNTVYRRVGPPPKLKKTDAKISKTPRLDRRRYAAPVSEPAAQEEAADAPEPVVVPQPPPAANTPTGGDVGAVVDYLEAARPVSAPPSEPEKKARRPRAGASKKTYAVFPRGALQEAILAHVQKLPEGTDATPYQVAAALNAYPGAVAYGLGRLVVKGNVQQTSDKPQRFAAV